MANEKTSNRRQYTDIVFLTLIGLCVVMIAVYQVQGATSVLMSQPEPTLTTTSRPSGGFVAPTRESEDFVGTLLPMPTIAVETPTTVKESPAASAAVGEEDS